MRTAQPSTVSYLEGTQFKKNPPIRSYIDRSQKHPNIECHEDALREAIDGMHNDKRVTIAVGALRSVFGHVTVREMHVPDEALDHHTILIRVGTLRDALKSTDRRRSNASDRS